MGGRRQQGAVGSWPRQSPPAGWGRRQHTVPSHDCDQVRYLLAWDHGLCRAVLAVYVRALLGFYRWRVSAASETGAAAV